MKKIASKRTVLRFSTKSYPTFGRGTFSVDSPPLTVTQSPYYWWYLFLQLNPDYIATHKAKGRGKCATLYGDLGDVSGSNFKAWWNDCAKYFAEKQKGYSMRIAESANQLAPFNNSDVVNLVVPLTWSQRSLKKFFNQIILKKLPQQSKGMRGVQVNESDAKYKLSGKWHIGALEDAYMVYTIKMSNPELPWADVAIRAKLDIAKELKEGVKTSQTSDVRRLATILALRHFKRAEEFIKATITGKFPYKK
jgi:hypothetical protein